MQKYCSLLVESYNIHHASPATISRLGMIYVDTSLLHGDAVFYKWLEAKDPKEWDKYINREDKLILNSDEYCKTVLDYALELGNYEFIKYLMDNGAKVILCSHMGKPHNILTEGFGLTKKEKKAEKEIQNHACVNIFQKFIF